MLGAERAEPAEVGHRRGQLDRRCPSAERALYDRVLNLQLPCCRGIDPHPLSPDDDAQTAMTPYTGVAVALFGGQGRGQPGMPRRLIVQGRGGRGAHGFILGTRSTRTANAADELAVLDKRNPAARG